MTPLYVPEPLPGLPVHPFFTFMFPDSRGARGLFRENWPPNYFEKEVVYVESNAADAIVLPVNFTRLGLAERNYIQKYVELGERLQKKVFLFSHTDFSDRLVFDDRVYTFRYSLYRDTKKVRDIMTPTIVEDLGVDGISARTKGVVPLVSFCGRAGFPNTRSRLSYLYFTTLYGILAILNPAMKARTLGVYWRRKTIAICTRSKLVTSNFIVRNSFSGHPQSIELTPEIARSQFIQNITESDFVLCPKGDGNYSNRFQEALSLGRFPVYIETESFLPLEKIVNYDEVIVRVPYTRMHELPTRICAFYDQLPEKEFQERQKKARLVFEQFLRPDAFFRYIFTKALPEGTLTELN